MKGHWGWVNRLLVTLLALCWLETVSIPVASAHAYIVNAYPAANQVLREAPREVRIQFDEPVQLMLGALTVTDEAGRRADVGDARVDPHNADVVECHLRPRLPAGLYTVHWRVISADGHPVEGVIPFTVGAAPQGRGSPAAAPGTSSAQTGGYSEGYRPGPAMILIRWLQYLAVLCEVGVLVFWRYVMPQRLRVSEGVLRRLRRALWVAWAGMLAGDLLNLPLQAAIDAGVSWGEALRGPVLADVVGGTSFGPVWCVQTGLTLALLWPLGRLSGRTARRPSPESWWWAAVAAGWGWLAAKSFTGHAAAGSGAAVAVPMDVVHLSAAAVWVGSLCGMVCLLPGLRELRADVQMRSDAWDTLRRFAPWGIASVFTLAVTGYFAATRNIPTVYAWVHTPYGQALLAKLSAFLVMFAFGVYHWASVRRRARRGKPGLHRTLWLEFTLGAVVLAVTAYLTNLPTAMSAPGPVDQTRSVGQGTQAHLRIEPNVVGVNRFDVRLTDAEGRPDRAVQQVTLSFSSLEMNMGTNTVRLTPSGPGQFEAQGMYLTMAGRWDVHLHVLTAGFTDLDADFVIVVGAPGA
ncbi:MAG: copper resistance CopC/CopD family protein [Alicyclobacillus sp.]|nr:copper resistance CopC/CopD family protein [Alicyclobacillus sp.]